MEIAVVLLLLGLVLGGQVLLFSKYLFEIFVIAALLTDRRSLKGSKFKWWRR